jgi:hypothetical protein
VESFGLMSDAAMQLLHRLGDVAAAGGQVSKAAFVQGAVNEISVAMQRGNGMCYVRSMANLPRSLGRAFSPGCEVPLQDPVEL